MKNFYAFILVLLFGAVVQAQSSIESDAKLKSKEIFAFKTSETGKPAREESIKQPAPPPAAVPAYSSGFNYESTPMGSYVGIFEIGGLFGVGAKITDPASFQSTDRIYIPYSQKFFSLQTIQGRQLNNRKVYMGFGFGFDVSTTPFLSNVNGNNSSLDFLIPLFLDVRGYILKGRISPFIEGKFGGSFCVPAPVSALNGYEIDGGALLGLN